MAPGLPSATIIVSIHRRERGVETIRHFAASVASCEGCLRRRRHTLTPMELVDDGANGVTPVGAPLCKACSLSLPLLSRMTRSTWPADFTAREAEHLWEMVRQEQVTQAVELGRADAPASRLQGFDGAPAAPQQTARHQGIDRTGKVA